MRRVLFACLSVLSLQVACVTPGTIGKEGFVHEALGYKIPLAPDGRHFIDDRWVLEQQTAKTYAVSAVNHQGQEHSVRFRSVDLMLKHKETRGILSVQSFPLDPVKAERKLDILAKDYAELFSSAFFAPLGTGKGQVDPTSQLTITSTQAGTLGTASTYEISFEVSQKRKYRMLIIRSQAEKGWIIERGANRILEMYPAAIVVTLANDAAYFPDTKAAFDALVGRLQLKE